MDYVCLKSIDSNCGLCTATILYPIYGYLVRCDLPFSHKSSLERVKFLVQSVQSCNGICALNLQNVPQTQPLLFRWSRISCNLSRFSVKGTTSCAYLKSDSFMPKQTPVPPFWGKNGATSITIPITRSKRINEGGKSWQTSFLGVVLASNHGSWQKIRACLWSAQVCRILAS